jgi:hypothetical protein
VAEITGGGGLGANPAALGEVRVRANVHHPWCGAIGRIAGIMGAFRLACTVL